MYIHAARNWNKNYELSITYASNFHTTHSVHGLKHLQKLILAGGDGRGWSSVEIVRLE